MCWCGVGGVQVGRRGKPPGRYGKPPRRRGAARGAGKGGGAMHPIPVRRQRPRKVQVGRTFSTSTLSPRAAARPLLPPRPPRSPTTPDLHPRTSPPGPNGCGTFHFLRSFPYAAVRPVQYATYVLYWNLVFSMSVKGKSISNLSNDL